MRHRLKTLIKSDKKASNILADGELLAKMQDLRNCLAHQEGVPNEDGVMTLAGNPQDVFDYKRFRQIRCDLRTLADKLENITI